MKTTSEVLNKAADLIQERGWNNGAGWVEEGQSDSAPLCLEGGIMAAIGMRFPADVDGDQHFRPLHACPAYKAVVKYLDRVQPDVQPDGVGFTGQPLYLWNDDGARTEDEVIEVLRAAAVIEAAKESAREPVNATS